VVGRQPAVDLEAGAVDDTELIVVKVPDLLDQS
jgi:hypothetical protein